VKLVNMHGEKIKVKRKKICKVVYSQNYHETVKLKWNAEYVLGRYV